VGLAVSGVATYVFFGIASRSLDAGAYSALSVLWGLMFAVGNGIMQPLEQEVARAVSHRLANGVGPGPVIRRAISIGLGFAAAVCALALVTHALVLDKWLDDDGTLTIAFVIGLLGFCVGHLARGTLSSHRRFRSYAAFFSIDGIARVVLAALLAVVGLRTAGAFGLVLAITPFLGVGGSLARQRGLLVDGPPASWSELTRALGWLLVGTVSLSLLIQGGTIAVGILATPDQEAAAGVFLNGLQTARIPLFLFQAVLASLLPKLSHLAGTGAFDDFVLALRRLVLTILGVGVITTVLAAALGPTFVSVVFGSTTTLSSRDLGLLAAAFILVMAAICIDQALIALNAHSRMAVGWLVALVVFVAVTAVAGPELYLRVELGLLAAGAVAFAWMAVALVERLRHHAAAHEVDLAEAAAELPIQ
jgi:O-antigen/teichoic acid export membrane protein